MGQKMDLWHPGVALSKSGPALATAVPNLAKFLLNRGGRSVGGADEREQPMGLADLVAGVPVTVLPNLNIPPREYSSRFRARHNSVTIAKFLRHFERPVTRICFDLQNFLF